MLSTSSRRTSSLIRSYRTAMRCFSSTGFVGGKNDGDKTDKKPLEVLKYQSIDENRKMFKEEGSSAQQMVENEEGFNYYAVSGIPEEFIGRRVVLRKKEPSAVQYTAKFEDEDKWFIIFPRDEKYGSTWNEPLMGWEAGSDSISQLNDILCFDSLKAAIAYCKRYGFEYTFEEPAKQTIRRNKYSDKFKFYAEPEDPWNSEFSSPKNISMDNKKK